MRFVKLFTLLLISLFMLCAVGVTVTAEEYSGEYQSENVTEPETAGNVTTETETITETETETVPAQETETVPVSEENHDINDIYNLLVIMLVAIAMCCGCLIAQGLSFWKW